MLAKRTIIKPVRAQQAFLPDQTTQTDILSLLQVHGYCLLRGFSFDLATYSSLINELCANVTFDPARQYVQENVQKVDAGADAIGMHIENGNTPIVPEIMSFYCRSAARKGSQTTLCDGIDVFNALNESQRAQLQLPMTVTRTLPEALWKAYLVNAHPDLTDIKTVNADHLHTMLDASSHHSGRLNSDGSLLYSVEIDLIRKSRLCGQAAFANAVLGPSFSYEKPVYEFADGSQLSDKLLHELSQIAEAHTVDIPWQDGDVAIIDNWRVMHGRRAILDSAHRELFVGMGNLS